MDNVKTNKIKSIALYDKNYNFIIFSSKARFSENYFTEKIIPKTITGFESFSILKRLILKISFNFNKFLWLNDSIFENFKLNLASFLFNLQNKKA